MMKMTTKFFEGESRETIAKYRPIFDKAVKAGREIAQLAGTDFYEIVEVRFFTPEEEKKITDAGSFCWNDEKKLAWIKMCRSADPECLTHEVGHCFFHPSLLHDRHGEPPRGDKFCNAFRYFLHPDKGTDWMAKDGGSYDGNAIVAKCQDLEAFMKYFAALMQKKRKDTRTAVLNAEGI
jgi:hypothetical protein